MVDLWHDWRVSLILASLCWGAWGFFGKIAVARLGWPTTMVVGWIIGLAVVAPVVVARFRWQGLVASWPAMVYGLGGALGAMFLMRALERGPAVAVLPMSELWLVVSVGLSAAFLGEELNWQRGLGLALVLAGAALLGRE